jgi:diguanylate cyclase (GGDEF)-like protein
MSNARQLLNTILDQRSLTVLFQPVVSFALEKAIGYEALIRGPKETELYYPRLLFAAAAEYGCLFELEWLATEMALQHFANFKEKEEILFVNVTPHFVAGRQWQDERLQALLIDLNLAPGQVVMELSEEIVPAQDPALLGHGIEHFRRLDLKVSIDDFGRASAGLRAWAELLPDWVKTDEYFVNNIHKDHRKKTALRALVEIAGNYGTKLVAKGIANGEVYKVVLELGVGYGQGYFLGEPAETPELNAKGQWITKAQVIKANRSETVSSIVHPSPFVTPDEPVFAAADLFLMYPEVHTLPVVQHGKVVGILRRLDFLNLWSSRYGRELYGKKPVAKFMEKDFIAVEADTPLEKLSMRLTNQMSDDALPDDFIVTKDGEYLGVGTVIALLRRITELQIKNAKQANPLTGLPGNVPIAETIDALLAEHEPFALCYVDIDNFKPYNDVYGYQRGDEVIKFVARVLSESVDPSCDFIGHIGGDDFVIIYRSLDWKNRLEKALEQFKEGVKDFYDPFDREHGIYAKDRQGQNRHFPIMSLSVGVVTPKPGQYHSHVEIAELATETKHAAKEIPGCSIFIDRRNDWGFGTGTILENHEEPVAKKESALNNTPNHEAVTSQEVVDKPTDIHIEESQQDDEDQAIFGKSPFDIA